MTFAQCQAVFGDITVCKLFPNDNFKYYSLKDTWPNAEEAVLGK